MKNIFLSILLFSPFFFQCNTQEDIFPYVIKILEKWNIKDAVTTYANNDSIPLFLPDTLAKCYKFNDSIYNDVPIVKINNISSATRFFDKKKKSNLLLMFWIVKSDNGNVLQLVAVRKKRKKITGYLLFNSQVIAS